MIDRIADGLLGFFIFFSHWFSFGSDSQEIKISSISQYTHGYTLECAIKLNWNEQLSDLLDAGIPLSFIIKSHSDAGDSMIFIRTLECDIDTYHYIFCDSIVNPSTDSVFVSKKYSHMYRAIKNYSHWICNFSIMAEHISIEAELLPSKVSQLHRSIDMSNICGNKRFSIHFSKKKWDKMDRKK